MNGIIHQNHKRRQYLMNCLRGFQCSINVSEHKNLKTAFDPYIVSIDDYEDKVKFNNWCSRFTYLNFITILVNKTSFLLEISTGFINSKKLCFNRNSIISLLATVNYFDIKYTEEFPFFSGTIGYNTYMQGEQPDVTTT